MKKRLYYLAYEGERLAASFDAHEGNKQLESLLELCKTHGYEVKEVPKNEFETEQRKAEEKDLREILG